MVWRVKPADHEKGGWVVEHHSGRQQHYGYRYTDRALADWWARWLTCFYIALGIDEPDENENKE